MTQRKAVAYVRISGKAQVGGDGIDRQRRSIQHYADKHNITIEQEFHDVISGTTPMQYRIGLSGLDRYLRQTRLNLVLVERLDRLARDANVGQDILWEWAGRGINITACEPQARNHTTTEDPENVLVESVISAVSPEQIQLAASQCSNDLLTQRLRTARNKKRRDTGKCEGPKFFGDLPGEQAAIDRIRELNKKPRGGKRLSLARIAKTLDSEGIRTRGGKPWCPQTINSIIKSQGMPKERLKK